MPGRYPSPLCPRCQDRNSPENCNHRYCLCSFVSQAWTWVRCILSKLDPFLTAEEDNSILCLDFERSLRENAILWVIGIYLEIVKQEVVIKDQMLSLATIVGVFKQRKERALYQAMPELGVIEGIDFEPQGVG